MNLELLEMRRSFLSRLEARVVAVESAFRARDVDLIEHQVQRLGDSADASGFMDLREECAALIDALRGEARRARQMAQNLDEPDQWIDAIDWIAIVARIESVRRIADSAMSGD